MGLKPFWTTAKGEKIPYSKLSDDHLKNIIKDGYRNEHMRAEAKRRKFKIPARPIDQISTFDIMAYVESFASCALAGNELGERMIKLLDENPALFLLELNALLKKEKREKKIQKRKIQGRSKPNQS